MASVTVVSRLTHASVSVCSAQAHSNVSAGQRTPKPAALSKCQLIRPCRPSVKVLSGVRLSSNSLFSRKARPFTPSISAAVAEGETVVEDATAVKEATAGGEVATEEAAEVPAEVSAEAPNAEGGEAKPAARRPFKNKRKITVKIEDLQPGQVLPGKVRSIQSYGCFVDIGAFTDGLIHISELADQFVENVGDLVQAGQEVQARILEVDAAKGRISLSMRTPREERPEPAEGDAAPRSERGAGGPRSQRGPDQRPRRAVAGGRGGSDKPSHGIRKGQKYEGTVTSIASFGAFLQLKEGVEGLLHASEIGEGSARVEVAEHLEVGQKVNVTVLSVTKDRISLTTKERVDTDDINVRLNQGAEVGTDGITNPFEAAFKKSNLVLDTLPGAEELAKTKKPEPVAAASDEIKTETQEVQKGGLFSSKVVEETATPAAEEPKEDSTPAAEESKADDSSDSGAAEAVQETVSDVVDDAKDAAEAVTEAVEPITDEVADVAEPAVEKVEEVAEPVAEKVEEVVEPVVEKVEEVVEPVAEKVEEAAEPVVEKVEEAAEPVAEKVEPVVEEVKETVTEAAETVAEKAEPVVEDVKETVTEAVEPVTEKVEPAVEEAKEAVAEASDAAENQVGGVVEKVEEVVESVKEAAEPVVEKVEEIVDSVKDAVAPAAEKTEEDAPAVEEAAPAAEAAKDDEPSLAEQVKEAADEGTAAVSGVVDQVTSAVEAAPAAAEEKPAAQEEKPKKEAGGISAALVKALREETGSGMMDCKKALAEAGGDLDKARDLLRKKGLASADKKAARVAAEGSIGSYIHDSRIGVLLELNCETDFVSRGDTFKELLEDLAMQVAACPQVEFVSVDEVPADVVAKEREIEAGKEDLASKPEAIREKMVDGRINKRLGELALLEQPFIKDDKLKVKDLIKATVAKIGENIQVRRFARFNLGEGLAKKTSNLAAEVAEQTQKKEAAPPAPAEAKKEDAPAAEAKPAVAVSASAVKELRAETGAGMMDCKKALAECENDVEKARELLRKKGLASAEKKSSRLAAEGAVGSYIHDGRIGVLVEVNCETDFVARGDKFKELLEDVAMQVAACPQVTVVSPDDVPADVVAKEREIELGKEDLASKPEAIREKIVDGRMAKRVNELALLEQPYIRDDKQKLRDVIQATVAAVGENIQVRRFVRFNLGEGIEKKSVDFAAEVAAQTGKA